MAPQHSFQFCLLSALSVDNSFVVLLLLSLFFFRSLSYRANQCALLLCHACSGLSQKLTMHSTIRMCLIKYEQGESSLHHCIGERERERERSGKRIVKCWVKEWRNGMKMREIERMTEDVRKRQSQMAREKKMKSKWPREKWKDK